MIEKYLPLIFALVIVVAHFYTNQFNISLSKKRKKHSIKVISFAAGISITYILLELLPKFIETSLSISKVLFISLPFGFIIHHLIEKNIYQHTRKHELMRIISIEENIFSFFYHIILGVMLVVFAKTSTTAGIIAFIPLLTFTTVSRLPMKPHLTKIKTIFMSSSTLIGAVIAIIWQEMPKWLEFSLIGLATGILLYTIIRHHIPFGKKGKIGYFTIGFILYSLFIIITWYI